MTKAEKAAYEAGKDYAVNGATVQNCHFALFATRKMTTEWEHGRDEQTAALAASKGKRK